MEPGYDRHVFICAHERPPGSSRGCCREKGSLELMSAIKRAAKAEGIPNIRVQKSGCLNFCEHGISCVVYPEGVWYTLTGEADIPAILEHLRTGTVAPHLLMKLED